MRFANPELLTLLLIPAGYAVYRWVRRTRAPAERLALPSFDFLAEVRPSRRERLQPVLPLLRIVGGVLLVIALARPQTTRDVREIRLRSRNIILALDISSSMKAGDFQPGNRLSVARQVVTGFVHRRQGDLIG